VSQNADPKVGHGVEIEQQIDWGGGQRPVHLLPLPGRKQSRCRHARSAGLSL